MENILCFNGILSSNHMDNVYYNLLLSQSSYSHSGNNTSQSRTIKTPYSPLILTRKKIKKVINKLSDLEKRSEIISLRVTPDEWCKLQAEADIAFEGNISNLIRVALEEYFIDLKHCKVNGIISFIFYDEKIEGKCPKYRYGKCIKKGNCTNQKEDR
jgi:hypothetical protein